MRHDEIYPDDPEPPDADMAWAVGLFEGEGCITISHSEKYAQPRLKLNSTDEDVVRRFHEIVGVGSVITDRAQERRGWKRQWVWTCGARAEVAQTLWEMLPYLGVRRERRAIEVLAACQS